MKGLSLMVQRLVLSEYRPTAVDFAVLLALVVVIGLTGVASLSTSLHAAF